MLTAHSQRLGAFVSGRLLAPAHVSGVCFVRSLLLVRKDGVRFLNRTLLNRILMVLCRLVDSYWLRKVLNILQLELDSLRRSPFGLLHLRAC